MRNRAPTLPPGRCLASRADPVDRPLAQQAQSTGPGLSSLGPPRGLGRWTGKAGPLPSLGGIGRAVIVLALWAAPWAAFAQSFDLGALMALLAQRKSAEARFTEERTVSSLDSPLYSKGTLSFAAPDRFTRVQTEPRAESMEVQGNTAILKRGGRTRTMALDSIPELAALVDAVRGTLSGDASRLQRHFKVDVAGAPARWQLALVPIDARLAAQVTRIEIVGQRTDVRSIDLRLAGGDRSLMQVEPLAGR